MPNNYTDTNVSDLIFNVLDSATYEDLSDNGQINNNQLYFITDDEGYKIKQSAITDNVGTSDSTNTSNRFVYSYSQTADGVISTKTRSLSSATSAEIGGIKIGYTKDGTKYPVELDNNNKAYVNVPIQDGVTYTFTNGTDGSFSVKPSNSSTTQKVTIGKPATAGAADAFSSGTTVTLTGVVTGTSDSSTKGWSVPTTIGNGVITNDMLTNSSFRIGSTDISLGNSFTASSFKRLLGLDAAMRFIGKATVTITDGSSTNPGIGGYTTESPLSGEIEAQAGDIIIDSNNSYEYIWTTEGKWERLGPDSNYKVVQSAVSSPSASGNATAFIDTISQNANGEITVTKKNLNTSGIWSGKANTAGTADVANSIEWDNVANKPNSFTPAAHAHGNITNTGDITAAAPTVANGDQLVINDHSASKITNGPTFDGETVSKALTPKGTWETFLTSHQSVSNKDATLGWGTTTNIATIGTTNINVTLPNNPNTDSKLSTAAVTNGTTYYPIVGTNTTDASTKFYDANGFTYTSTSDAAKLTLGNNVASGTNNRQGQLVLYGTTAYATTITPGAPTEARTITLPNKDGTVALTSDIPAAYTLTQATSSALGGIKIGYSESGKNYAIKLNNDGQAYVSVPWTDNNDNTRYEFNTSAQENKIQYREIGSSTWIDVPFTPSIVNNITGVGNRTANHIAVFNNTNTITDGPAFGTSETTFLRNDQTWQPLPVTSVAGKSGGAVQLGTLTIGNKTYNGSESITISLEDLNIASTTTMLGITDTPIDEDDPNTSTNPQINLVVPASGLTTAVDSNIVMRQDTGEEFVWLSGAWHKMGVASSYALEHHIHGNITSGGAITNETAITNDSRLVITDGNNKVTRVVETLKFDTSQTGKALSQAGTWIDVNNYILPTASASVLGGVKVGSGLSISSGVLSHTDTSSQASITASGRRYITGVTLDTYGHVTGLTTGTETVTDTRNTAGATDTSDKIFLIGAKTQAENPQTYSDDEVYATSGVLTAKTFNSTSLTASQAVSTDANKNLVSTNLTTNDPTANGNGITYIASISQNAVGKITATKSTVRDATDSQSGVVNTGAQTFAGNKTFNNNIIFADANVGIQRVGRSVQWIDGRDGALVKTTSINTNGYSPIISTKTTDGSWEIGAYDSTNYLNDLVFTYCTDENYDADTNTTTAQIKFQEDGSIVAKLIGNVTGDLTGNADSATSANITSTQNAVAYYTDAAGTFGSKASANGVLYATSTNGALEWGTLPVAQGGTGKTEFTANSVIMSGNTTTAALVTRTISDSSSAAAIGTNTNIPTERDIYYGLPTINNSHDYTSSTTIYAPTTGGTANTQALVGNGVTTTPKWINISPSITITAGTASATPKINVTVLGQSGTAQSLTTASTSIYGATKLSSTSSSTEQGLAATPKLIYDSIAALNLVTQRTYRSSTNIELPIAGVNTVNSTTAAYAAIASGNYKDVYAAIPEDTTKVATLNPSTGVISATTFKPLNSYFELDNVGLRDIELGYAVEFNEEFGRIGRFDTLFINSNVAFVPYTVTQTATTTNANYEILFSNTADNTTRIETTRKSNKLTFNPSTGILGFQGIQGASNISYGETLPTDGAEGRIFFQISEPSYEIPLGGAAGQALIKASASDRDVTWGAVGGIMTPSTTTKYYVSGSASTAQNSDPAIFNTSIYVENSVLFGAAWNDYAEYRETTETIEPGRVVQENGDDTLKLANHRLEPGCEIVSDTFGFAIGETEKSKTPIAATGRVLAYPCEDRELFKEYIGRPVCSGPNGTVSIMTEEEERRYPSRIIGTISAVPDYEEWGTNNIKVNGRIWIRIR